MLLQRKIQTHRPSQKGLTFIEVMIVLIILGGIAALVGPAMFSKVDEAKVKQAKIQMKSLASALDLYHMDNGSYPEQDLGLEALIHKPETGAASANWRGPYLKSKSIPLDPWEFPYEYRAEGGSFTLRSLGADHEEGGEDSNEDIYHE